MKNTAVRPEKDKQPSNQNLQICLLNPISESNDTEWRDSKEKGNPPTTQAGWCSGRVITPSELQAELARDKGGKNLITKE